MSRRNSRIFFISFSLLSYSQLIYYYLLLPDNIASHFGLSDQPDGWMDKSSFSIAQFVLITIIIVLFSIIGWSMRKVPHNVISMPNKDYWLAEERREESISIIENYIYWFGGITLIFFLLLTQRIYQFNVDGTSGALGEIWVFVVLYLAATVIWTVKLISVFKLPKPTSK